MSGEHFSTTKDSKSGHFRWQFLILFCHKPCKKYAGQEKCAFFKSRIRIRDPVLKFWFAGSGAGFGRKWTGSATLNITYPLLSDVESVMSYRIVFICTGTGVMTVGDNADTRFFKKKHPCNILHSTIELLFLQMGGEYLFVNSLRKRRHLRSNCYIYMILYILYLINYWSK